MLNEQPMKGTSLNHYGILLRGILLLMGTLDVGLRTSEQENEE